MAFGTAKHFLISRGSTEEVSSLLHILCFVFECVEEVGSHRFTGAEVRLLTEGWVVGAVDLNIDVELLCHHYWKTTELGGGGGGGEGESNCKPTPLLLKFLQT